MTTPSFPETGATTYFTPLLILFLVLNLTSALQVIGLGAQHAQLGRTKEQVIPTLEKVAVVKNLSEHLFKDIIVLAPHNADAAQIQAAYGIRLSGAVSAATPSN